MESIVDRNKFDDVNWAAYATIMGCGILFLLGIIPGQTVSVEMLYAIAVSTVVSAIIALAEIVMTKLK